MGLKFSLVNCFILVLLSKSKQFLLLGCLAVMGCSNSLTYEKQFNQCLENVEKREFKILSTGKTGYGYVNADPNCLLGALLPEFNVIDINGNRVTNKSIKGKINIINFWFIKCKPCIIEIPSLNILTEKYSNDEINFLAFTLDGVEELKGFLQENPFHFKIIPDSKNIINNTFHVIYGYPFTLISNKKNKIIGVVSKSNPETIIAKIDSILCNEM